jgi:hypothetical protein
MDDPQYTQETDNRHPSESKDHREKDEEVGDEGKIDVMALFASALNLGSIPTNPADYIHHIIARVKVPIGDREQTLTVAQFVAKCKEDGLPMDIDNSDGMASTIAAMQAEHGVESRTAVTVLLHLVVKGKNDARRQKIDNLIWGFTMAEQRDDYT